MPWAVDELEITNHDGITGYFLVDDGSAARSAGAQRAAFVRAVIRDRVKRPVDVVDTDTMASDRDQFVCARRDFVECGYDVLTPLREPGRFRLLYHGSEHSNLALEGRNGFGKVIRGNAVAEHHRLTGVLGQVLDQPARVVERPVRV